MSRTFSTLTLGLLVALTGCPSGDDSSTSVADGSTGTPTTTTGETNPGTTEMTSVDTTEGPATTSMSGSTTDTPGTTTDVPGTTTDEPGTTTEPGTTGEVDACAMCVEANCGDELAACMMDADCTCFQDCAAMNPGIAGALACAGDCGIPLPDLQNGMTVVGALAVCTQDNCPKCLM